MQLFYYYLIILSKLSSGFFHISVCMFKVWQVLVFKNNCLSSGISVFFCWSLWYLPLLFFFNLNWRRFGGVEVDVPSDILKTQTLQQKQPNQQYSAYCLHLGKPSQKIWILWNNFTKGRGWFTRFHISIFNIYVLRNTVKNLNKDFIKSVFHEIPFFWRMLCLVPPLQCLFGEVVAVEMPDILKTFLSAVKTTSLSAATPFAQLYLSAFYSNTTI